MTQPIDEKFELTKKFQKMYVDGVFLLSTFGLLVAFLRQNPALIIAISIEVAFLLILPKIAPHPTNWEGVASTSFLLSLGIVVMAVLTEPREIVTWAYFLIAVIPITNMPSEGIREGETRKQAFKRNLAELKESIAKQIKPIRDEIALWEVKENLGIIVDIFGNAFRMTRELLSEQKREVRRKRRILSQQKSNESETHEEANIKG